MRLWPTRIVLAALALIVGAVLALPMLLSRKAEAGDSLPKLEADAGTGWLVAASHDTEAPHTAEMNDLSCGDAPEIAASLPLVLVAGSDRSSPEAEAGTRPPTATHSPLERRAEVLPSRPAASWPDPHTLDRQRKYHLRP